ncbi:MAG: tetratricopeptide repeat protein [Clostridia bacterium]|nr:MAG: tetratricopeptide repeat protein [Clostridia bacterium]
MLQSIRKNKRATRIPFIILTIAIAASLVGYFAMGSGPLPSVPVGEPAGTNAGDATAAAVSQQQTSIRQLEQALKLNESNPQLWVQLGNAYYDLGGIYSGQQRFSEAQQEFSLAVDAYRKSLAMDGSQVDVRVDMATAAYFAGRDEDAEKNFTQVLEQNPDHLIANLNYGVFLADRKNNYEKAVTYWQKVVKLDPDGLGPQAKKLIESMKPQG